MNCYYNSATSYLYLFFPFVKLCEKLFLRVGDLPRITQNGFWQITDIKNISIADDVEFSLQG